MNNGRAALRRLTRFAPQTGCLSAFLALTQKLFLPRDFFGGEHGPPASLQAAVTGSGFARIAVKEVVIVGQFFAGLNIARGNDPDAIIDLVGFAVRIARMVYKGRHAEAVNNRVAIIHGEEVGYLGIGVHAFARLGGKARTRILKDARALLDWSCAVHSGSMQR